MLPLHSQTKGTLAEWLGNGLQNRLRRFESARYLTREAYHTIRLFSFLSPPASAVVMGRVHKLIINYKRPILNP